MFSHRHGVRSRLISLATLALASSLAGCGSTDTSTQATPAPATEAPASSNQMHTPRHHRHRHHGGSQYGSEGASAGTAAGNVAASAGSGASGASYPCNDPAFATLQQQYASGAVQGDREVDVCGTVTGVRTSHVTRSRLHGYYDLQVASGDTIEIVCDLGEMNAPAWPWVKVGDYSYVQGRYYFDSSSSQGIDWTHHGTSRNWPSAGYVVVAGTQYQ